MKILRKGFAVFLALAMLLSALPALAADVCGEQLQVLDTTLNQGTTLYNEVYWTGSTSTAASPPEAPPPTPPPSWRTRATGWWPASTATFLTPTAYPPAS